MTSPLTTSTLSIEYCNPPSPPLNGMLVHYRVTPALCDRYLFKTPVWREFEIIGSTVGLIHLVSALSVF